MVPQNQHVVVRVVLVSAETEEACQCVGIGGILQRQILNLFHFAFFINKALGTVGVDQLIAPVSGTAGLDNDADIVRPYVGCHLTDVGGGTTFPVRNYNVLRHHCGRGNRPVRIASSLLNWVRRSSLCCLPPSETSAFSSLINMEVT